MIIKFQLLGKTGKLELGNMKMFFNLYLEKLSSMTINIVYITFIVSWW